MSTYQPFWNPKVQFMDNAGLPLNGGKLYTYIAGTTTALATYSDTSGTSNANPVILDSAGRATVYLGGNSYKFILKTSADVQIWSQDNVAAVVLASNFENIRIVDSANTAGWAGSDVGGWCNAAYAALPASGGEIWIVGGTLASPLAFTTPMVFGTGNKPCLLRGISGAVINFTPNSGTAIGLNWGGVGEGWCGIRDLTMLGSGNANTAVAVSVASRGVVISGLKLASSTSATGDGYGTGIQFTSSGYISQLKDSWVCQCTTAVNWSSATERTLIQNCCFSHNGTHLNSPVFAATNDVVVIDCSFDDATTIGLNLSTGAYFLLKGCHFEDADFANGSVTQFATLAGNAFLQIEGGVFITDRTTATQTQWITAGGTSRVHLIDVNAASAGATVTQFVNFSSTASGDLSIWNSTAGISNAYNTAYTGGPVVNRPVGRLSTVAQIVSSNGMPVLFAEETGIGSASINSAHRWHFCGPINGQTSFKIDQPGTFAWRFGMTAASNVFKFANTDDLSAPQLQLDPSGNLTTLGSEILQTANGSQWVRGVNSELLTLSTSGATTDTSANLLPANSIIEAVVARITTTITTATDWKLGDSVQAARFTIANATLAAGTTTVGLLQADPTVATANLGPVQTSAAKVRVTTTGTPGAGVIRISVYYRQFVAPTS